MSRLSHALLAATALCAASNALAAGNAVKGKEVFQRCAICHRADKDGGNGLGPNLFGVVGRKAGSAANFSYSAAMKSAGFVWSADKLTLYVQHPQKVLPGNRMAFAGLFDPAQAADVVAYLGTLK